MNRVINQAFKPGYFFSQVVKKKQMELTLRTPYRTCHLIQKQFCQISQGSPELQPVPSNQQWLCRTEPLELCMCCPLGHWKSSWPKKFPEYQEISCTLEDGSLSTVTTHVKSMSWIFLRRKTWDPIKCSRPKSRKATTLLESTSPPWEKMPIRDGRKNLHDTSSYI